MVAGLITVALLTGKLATTAAAGHKVMDRHEEAAKEREERSKR